MTFILPCALIKQVLNAAGFTDVNYDKFESRALSAEKYVFLEQLAGSTPHILYSNRPTIQVVVYCTDADDYTGKNKSLRVSYDIQAALEAARGVPFTEGGIHRVITRVDPNRQDIGGLPYGCGRSVAQYDFILSNKSHWGVS